MLGKILQTVGERTAFCYDENAGYHTAACFDFPCAHMQPFVSDNGYNDNNSVGVRDDMSQRASTQSLATKLCAVTCRVEALGPHTVFCLPYCCFKEDNCIVYMKPQVSYNGFQPIFMRQNRRIVTVQFFAAGSGRI